MPSPTNSDDMPLRTVSDLLELINVTSTTSATISEARFENASKEGLIAALSRHIYTTYHAVDRTTSNRQQHLSSTDYSFIQKAKHAIPWQSAPLAVRAHDQRIVSHDGVRILLPNAWNSQPPRQKLCDVISIPAIRSHLSPGFILVTGPNGAPLAPLGRLYFSCATPSTAVSVWTSMLNPLSTTKLRFNCKLLDRTGSFPRTDAIVLYLSLEDVEQAVELLVDIAPTVPGEYSKSIFTKPLTPYMSFAEEPRSAPKWVRTESFGQHRSRMVAEAAIRAFETGRTISQEFSYHSLKNGFEALEPWANSRTAATDVFATPATSLGDLNNSNAERM